jgi:hypothetical protein
MTPKGRRLVEVEHMEFAIVGFRNQPNDELSTDFLGFNSFPSAPSGP